MSTISRGPGTRISSRRLVAVTVASVLIAVGSVLGSSPRALASSGAITVVRATDTHIVVSGTAPTGVSVAVHALGTEQAAADWAEVDAIATVTAASNGTFDAALPRTDENGSDLMYDQFVAVAGQEQLGGAHYVDEYAFTPVSDRARPEPASPKGLVVAQLTDDAEELGVSHSIVNVTLNRLLRPAPGENAETIAFESGGRTWWVDAQRISDLDQKFRVLTDNGVVPSAILKLESPIDRDGEVAELVHPDAIPNAVPGEQYMFNTATADGVAAYTAVVEFLAQRWTREDGRYGVVPNWIVGNEVDQAFKWMNMGEVDLTGFIETYARAVRLTDQVVQQAWSDARTYVPLTHCWSTACTPGQQNRYYSGRDVIDELNRNLKAEGDVNWGVAYHPYPGDLLSPRVWDDDAPSSFDAPVITPKNIEVLPRYMGQPELQFQGQTRSIAATEWGCNTPSYSERDLAEQAACFAYSHYRMRFTPGIEWYNYFRDLDYELTSSSPVNWGWWGTDPAQPTVRQPVGPAKPVYDVAKYIDTSRSLEFTEPLLEVIGADDWADIVPGFDPSALADRELPKVAGAQLGGRLRNAEVVADFADGAQGWRLSDNASALEAVDGTLNVSVEAKAAKQHSGARVDFPEPLNLRRSSVLGFRIRTAGDQGVESSAVWSATARVYASDGSRVDAESRVTADGKWQQVSVDLRDWKGRSSVTGLKIQLSATSNLALSTNFSLDDIAVARTWVPEGPRAANLSVRASVAATTAAAVRPGDKLSLEIRNDGFRSPANTLLLESCEGVGLDPAGVSTNGIATGRTRTLELTVASWAPTNSEDPALCVRSGDSTWTVPVDLVPPPPPPAPPSPAEHPNVEISDDFSAAEGSYDLLNVVPENQAVPTVTYSPGVVSATADKDWFGAFRSDVAPASPQFSTAVDVRAWAPDGIGNIAYTGVVKDSRNAIMGLYVKSARYAAFEVRVDGNTRLAGQISNLDIGDDARLGFSLDGPSASLWVDRGAGWQLLGSTVLRGVPDFADPAVRSQWRYAFSLRSLAGETISAAGFEARSR